jgi:hypothetical protein
LYYTALSEQYSRSWADLSGSPEFTPVLVVSVLLDLLFSVCFLDPYLFFCLSFELWILITPLVSSSSSCTVETKGLGVLKGELWLG